MGALKGTGTTGLRIRWGLGGLGPRWFGQRWFGNFPAKALLS